MANGTKFSQFTTVQTVSSDDFVVGLKNNENAKFSFSRILAWLKSVLSPSDIGAVPTSREINGKALTADITLDASDVGAVDTADVGVADGVASLDSTGKVPGTQLDLSGKQDEITASGILKGDGAGGVSAATPGTDYGTYSKPSGGIPSTDMTFAVQTSLGKADTAYQKPSSGIPSSDMASGVQTSLGKADTAYQKPSGGIPASDLANGVIPTVPSAYTSDPAMDGTANPGSSGAWADGSHVHPSDTSRVSVYGMGKNLLDNAYFVGGGSQLGDGIFPINQRGQTSYSTDGYTIDRWWFNPYSYGTFTLTSAGLQIAKNGATSSPGLRQDMEHDLNGQIVTFTALDDAGNLYTFTSGTLDNTVSGWQASRNFGTIWVGIRYISGKWSINVTTTGITLAALKLEIGTQSTLAYPENAVMVLAALPDFWAEYANAQRYLKVVNAWRDLYAARIDNNNLSFFIPGHMVKAPSALSAQQIYYYSASSGNVTGNISFVSVPNGVYGSVSRGSLSANTGGAVVFPAAVYISAEQ